MSREIAAALAFRYRQVHERALQLAHDLTDEQLRWRADGRGNSIAFNLWHMARWADVVQAEVPLWSGAAAMADQLWDARGWDLDPAALGGLATGMELPEGEAAELALPDKTVLLDYVARAFAAVDSALETVEDEHLARPLKSPYFGNDTWVASVWTNHVAHENRHLGMIEVLRGLQGLRGTATV